MEIEEKIQELAQKYEIPVDLLKEAIELEKEKVTNVNRRLAPKLVELIAQYAELSE